MSKTEQLPEQKVQIDLEKPTSEQITLNKNFLSNESSDLRRQETQEESKDVSPIRKDKLKEKIDDSAHVKQCLNRKDVVIKSILRSMRKYYADLLQDNSDYKRKIRNIKLKHKKLINCSIALAHSLDLGGITDNVAFYLAAVAFPQDLKKILVKQLKNPQVRNDQVKAAINSVDTIEKALTRFSKQVIEDFLNIPEICLLLLHYLNKVSNPDYKNYFKVLNEMATTSLENHEGGLLTKVNRCESQMIQITK